MVWMVDWCSNVVLLPWYRCVDWANVIQYVWLIVLTIAVFWRKKNCCLLSEDVLKDGVE